MLAALEPEPELELDDELELDEELSFDELSFEELSDDELDEVDDSLDSAALVVPLEAPLPERLSLR